jgi:type II secretory pathway pseudopilin PulG
MPTLFKAQNGVIGLWAAGTLKPGAVPAERTYRQTVFSTMPIIFCRKHKESPGGERGHALLRQDDGFTLVEVLMAAVILIVGITALFGLLDSSVKASYQTRAREGATNLARQILEDAHTIPYAQLSSLSITKQLQEMQPSASQLSTSPWKVSQRGVTYTVTASECAIDDPKDGYGKHTAGVFCSGEPEYKAGESVKDEQPEDLKRITVKVTWVAQGRSPEVRQALTVTAAGEAVGLSASELKLSNPAVSAPTAPVITTEPAGKELTFTVTAPTGTTAVVWSLEGIRQSPAPTLKEGTTTTWTFSWPVNGLSDGTYQVSAQAVNATGVTGPPVSISVVLIRGTPAAPKGIQGGFNTVNVSGTAKKVVELKWQANAERNVIGYRVYRPNGAAKELACPASSATLSLALTCIDFNPPAPTAANLKYEVVALYRKANPESTALSEEVSEGPAGSFTVTGGEPLPAGPNVPEGPLTLVKNADGSVTLKWSAPKSGGAAVSFYRIYRGSTNYKERYDVTALGTTTEYTDTDATETHTYWVTAVSSSLSESPFLGPVSG